MATIALYRKYRSQNFGEVLGQDHVSQTLKNALVNKRISHAYLFSGPRGVGKTSVARIMAKAVNCQDSKKGEPCNKCNPCQTITDSKALDLIEIDAASNRGIDEIRELREKIRFAPSETRYKVFIIDEVHMLTKDAFNALLKTLEEPPPHAIFILATTEVHKIPQTVLSRCQRFDFRRIQVSDIVNRLEFIAKNEGINIDKEALDLIAESSEGGFRDAISLLDQAAAYTNKKVNLKDVESILGITDLASVEKIVDFISKSDSKNSVELINELLTKGHDLKQFAKRTIDYLRKILLFKVVGDLDFGLTEERKEKLKKLASEISLGKVIKAIDAFVEAEKNFKSGEFPQLVLEMAVVKLNKEELEEIEGTKEIKKKIEKTKQEAGNMSKDIKDIKVGEKKVKESQKKVEETNPLTNAQDKNKKEKSRKSSSLSEEDIIDRWEEFLFETKSKNNSIHAFLKASRPTFKENEIILSFKYKFHKERIEDYRNRQVVEEVLEKVYDYPYKIKCMMEKTDVKIESKKSQPPAGQPEAEKSKKDKDLLDSTLEILGGEIIE